MRRYMFTQNFITLSAVVVSYHADREKEKEQKNLRDNGRDNTAVRCFEGK